MCVASADQKWRYFKSTKVIKSELDNGTLGVIDCNGSAELPLVTVFAYDINPLCNGDEAIWDMVRVADPPSYCNGSAYQCVHICNRLYENDNDSEDRCLYADTIKGKDFVWSLWDDGTIRAAEECTQTQDGNICDDCRCLQYRPYLGVNAFELFVAKDVQPDGGVQVIKFTPVPAVN